MSILIDRQTRVLVQGATGREGSFHTARLLEYGTQVVAGVTPGRGGEAVAGVPVFDTAREAVDATGADCSIVFVPAPAAADAVLEAAEAGIGLIVCITEGIPTLDVVRLRSALRSLGSHLIGPNCPGVITPGQCKVGIMPGEVFSPGRMGVISRSGTLVYEAVAQLTARGIGQSTCVGVGGDPVLGTGVVEALQMFERDPDTDAVVLVGEIGGRFEQDAAEYVEAEMAKPVVAFIAGVTAPPGRRMGHAGAIIVGAAGSARAKMEALADAGATVVQNPADIGAAAERVQGDL